jgi:hypothetical protein
MKRVTFTCIKGHKHFTFAGTLRGCIAAAKRGDMGEDAKILAWANAPFLLCPDDNKPMHIASSKVSRGEINVLEM